ncbi:MAG: hypothetical protein QXK37_01445 [Candidatus Woesearchaeota archaeon]
MTKKSISLFLILVLVVDSLCVFGQNDEPDSDVSYVDFNRQLEQISDAQKAEFILKNYDNPAAKEAALKYLKERSTYRENELQLAKRVVEDKTVAIAGNERIFREVLSKIVYEEQPESFKRYLSYIADGSRVLSMEDNSIAQKILVAETGVRNILLVNGISYRYESSIGRFFFGAKDGKDVWIDFKTIREDSTIKAIEALKGGGYILRRETGPFLEVLQGTIRRNGEGYEYNGEVFRIDTSGKELKNSVSFSVSDGSSIVSCANGCALQIGEAEIVLNQNGVLQRRENNNLQVNDGVLRIGDNLLAGKFIIKLDETGSAIDLSNQIELMKFERRSLGKFNSFIILKDPKKDEGRHFGDVEIATGSGGNSVAVCFACNSFDDMGKDGSVRFTVFDYGNCNALGCDKGYKAEITGLVAARFERDTFHEGFDKNLKVSYYTDGKDPTETPMAVLKIESCDGCKSGKDTIVGVNIINNKFIRIGNDYYSSEHRVPQLHYMENRIDAGSIAPYIEFAKFNEFGITFADNDIYNPNRGSDVYGTGVYRSNNLQGGGDGGSKSVKRYLDEFEYLHGKQAVSTFNKGDSQRNIYIVDDTAFNFDNSGTKISVQNLYTITKEDHLITDQFRVVERGTYQWFFSTKAPSEELMKLLETKDYNNEEEKKAEFERLFALKQEEIFLKSRLQFVSAIIDSSKAVNTDSPRSRELIREILATYPVEEAKKLIGVYQERYEGGQQIFSARVANPSLTLPEIFASTQSPEIQAAFHEPYLLHQMNKEIAELMSTEKVPLFYLEEGKIEKKIVNREDAEILSALEVARAYLRKEPGLLRDGLVALKILGGEITSSLSADDQKIFQNFLSNAIEGRKLKGAELRRHTEGTVEFIDEKTLTSIDKGVTPHEYIQIELDGKPALFFASPEIIEMIKENKIPMDAVTEFAKLNLVYKSEERWRNAKVVFEEIIPKSPLEIALNLAPEITTIGKGVSAVIKANSLIGEGKEIMYLTANLVLGSIGAPLRTQKVGLIEIEQESFLRRLEPFIEERMSSDIPKLHGTSSIVADTITVMGTDIYGVGPTIIKFVPDGSEEQAKLLSELSKESEYFPKVYGFSERFYIAEKVVGTSINRLSHEELMAVEPELNKLAEYLAEKRLLIEDFGGSNIIVIKEGDRLVPKLIDVGTSTRSADRDKLERLYQIEIDGIMGRGYKCDEIDILTKEELKKMGIECLL